MDAFNNNEASICTDPHSMDLDQLFDLYAAGELTGEDEDPKSSHYIVNMESVAYSTAKDQNELTKPIQMQYDAMDLYFGMNVLINYANLVMLYDENPAYLNKEAAEALDNLTGALSLAIETAVGHHFMDRHTQLTGPYAGQSLHSAIVQHMVKSGGLSKEIAIEDEALAFRQELEDFDSLFGDEDSQDSSDSMQSAKDINSKITDADWDCLIDKVMDTFHAIDTNMDLDEELEDFLRDSFSETLARVFNSAHAIIIAQQGLDQML